MDNAVFMREVITEGAYGVLPPGDSYDQSLPIAFLRATELRPNLQIDLKFCHQVAREYMIRKARVHVGDVLLAVKGATIASPKCVAVIEKDIGETVINGSIFRMQFKPHVLPKFAAVVLDTPILKRQMRLSLIANNGVDYLDKALINSLIFPVPVEATQRKVIDVYELASSRFQLAQIRAKQLQADIDDYLLTELGINLPSEPENTIVNRIFTAQRRELAGWRFDPYYFNIQFHALEHAVEAGSYSTVSISRLFLSMNNGIDCRDFVEDGVPYVKVADVRAFEISPDKAQKVPVTAVPERGIVRKGQLLLTRKGSFGIAALVDHNDSYAISSEVFRIELDNNKVSGEYLVTLLNSKLCQSQFDREKIGAIMGSLTQAALSRIHIPLPPLMKQKNIAEFASSIRLQSKQLVAEAENELEIAKHRIEAMLLGEVEI
ncbi:MAG: restriction endonuclease subunit S [Methylobacter sp.]|nr:restriction endonuclease subunit S [Methylobacter sp.]